MTTTTTETALFSGTRRSIHHLTGIQTDGVAETAVTKVDISTLTGPDGSAPSSVTVEAIEWSIHGVDADELENPKQKLPPVESRMSKLKRLIDDNHPRKEEYHKQLKVYQTLLHPEQAKSRGLWNSLWRG